MGVIKVIEPGLLTTVQDTGRYGYRAFGVPVSGAMDKKALRVANKLVGNLDAHACLEITLIGPVLDFLFETTIALTGAKLPARLNGYPVGNYEAINVKKGDQLSFDPILHGCRAYVAIAGGINVPLVMGSRSCYLRGKFGGYEGRALKAGDDLQVSQVDTPPIRRLTSNAISPKLSSQPSVRVVAGPEIERFTNQGILDFMTSMFKSSMNSDRMGYRLEGPKISHLEGADIISSPLTEGTIQVSGNGQPIIMMADHQTTGGYTRIAQVVSADISLLAQLRPGDQVSFVETTLRSLQS